MRQSTNNKTEKSRHHQSAPSPFVGEPLDGHHYLDVIEEQIYSDQRPSREEQRPHRQQ